MNPTLVRTFQRSAFRLSKNAEYSGAPAPMAPSKWFGTLLGVGTLLVTFTFGLSYAYKDIKVAKIFRNERTSGGVHN